MNSSHQTAHPPDAVEILDHREVFRLVRGNPAADADFRSQRAEQPDKVFEGICECVARGLSVFASLEAGQNASRLPRLRGRLICRVRLSAGAGFIKPTGRNPDHRTWWPLASYSILSHTEVPAA